MMPITRNERSLEVVRLEVRDQRAQELHHAHDEQDVVDAPDHLRQGVPQDTACDDQEQDCSGCTISRERSGLTSSALAMNSGSRPCSTTLKTLTGDRLARRDGMAACPLNRR
jgi:hypothetical protein